MKTCKTCKAYTPAYWHDAQGGGKQHNGKCSALVLLLKQTNHKLFFWENDDIEVFESFGCVLHKGK